MIIRGQVKVKILSYEASEKGDRKDCALCHNSQSFGLQFIQRNITGLSAAQF